MLKTNLLIAFRNIRSKPVHSFINIFGFAIGLASCMFILLYVLDEMSYDRFHENGDRVYRMALERIYPEHTRHYAIIPSGFSEVVASDIPEVEDALRLISTGGFGEVVMEIGDQHFLQKEIMFADSNFFDFFSVKLLAGNPATALNKPNSVILTQAIGRKLFGEENPMGKQLQFFGAEFQVTGVMEEIPEQSHFDLEVLASIKSKPFPADWIGQPNYISFSTYTYLLLRPGTDPAVVEAKLPEIVDKYAAGQIEAGLGQSYEEYTAAGNGYVYTLQALTDIHLTSHLESEIKANGNETYVKIFSLVALFILVLASINFMNLSTARAADRAKEVGLRKVLGSYRGQIIRQFLSESVLLTLLSLAVGLGLVVMGMPWFNEISGKQLSLNLLEPSWLIPAMLLFAILTGILAGSYPALVLSSFEPASVLKGKFYSSSRGKWLRNGLVVFQFMISVGLMAATVIVFEQMQYIQDKDLGFSQEGVVVIDRIGTLENKYETFKNELLSHNDVFSFVGGGSTLPGGYFWGLFLKKPGDAEVRTMSGVVIDDDYLEALGIPLAQGRSFSAEYFDSLSVILNTSAASELGLMPDPIGKQVIRQNAGPEGNEDVSLTVVGLVDDFHWQSLHMEVGSLGLFSLGGDDGPANLMVARIKPGKTKEAIALLEKNWRELNPQQPFTYEFLDEQLEEMYLAEQKWQQIFGIFSVLAILIACIGLFGLATFTAEQRSKEIGIRKVLGASVGDIVLLLNRNFTLLILLAIIIAVPLVVLGMDSWLTNFYYRITIGWEVFVLSGLGALAIAWATMSYQSLRAATGDPARALKDE